MNNDSTSHLFWGKSSPLASLCGGALVIMSSVRLAYALVIVGSILWVCNISVLIFQAAQSFFQVKGRTICQAFLASFSSGLYLLMLWFLCPMISLEVFFIISLVPLFCVASGIFDRIETLDIADSVSRAFFESAVLGIIILLFAIVREPLGCLSLSLPGGSQGIIMLFSFDSESFLPVRIIASSSGALLLLGYGVCLYRYFRMNNAPREDDV